MVKLTQILLVMCGLVFMANCRASDLEQKNLQIARHRQEMEDLEGRYKGLFKREQESYRSHLDALKQKGEQDTEMIKELQAQLEAREADLESSVQESTKTRTELTELQARQRVKAPSLFTIIFRLANIGVWGYGLHQLYTVKPWHFAQNTDMWSRIAERWSQASATEKGAGLALAAGGLGGGLYIGYAALRNLRKTSEK